jgi:hypothetical protein
MMKVIRERIGDADVLIQALDDGGLEGLNFEDEGPALVNTGIEDDIQDAYEKAKTVIKNVATDFGSELDDIRKKTHVKQMELEFSLGFSAQAKAWVVGVKADSALKVKLTW